MKKITKVALGGAGGLALFGVYLLGKINGRDGLINEAVDALENGGESPVFDRVKTGRDKNFIYEIKAECIGD